MRKIPELLAPAGGMPQLKAAVENGADAVYLGGNMFNARQYAANFDDSEIKEAIEYAHVRGTKVYIALNTLIKDSEIDKALQYACFVYDAGADAVIVQDLGFAAILHKTLPDMPLHFSTQGSIYNLDGVKTAAALGFSRVVLARELSGQEIRYITRRSPIEIEMFVHGAMCVSYSGQCLMSSMIGGRSGNRGECAQPCRLPYELFGQDEMNTGTWVQAKSKGCLLSLKDMCLLEHISDIADCNVKCIKIEGRMKSPEYTAIVTGIYRKYLDIYAQAKETQTDFKEVKVSTDDKKRLLQIFNRGGFTSAYFTGKIGPNMVAPQRGKNWGTYLGTVTRYSHDKEQIEIKLDEPLALGDGIEIISDGLPGNVVTSLRCKTERLKSAPAGSVVWAGYIKGNIRPGDLVYKVTDKELNKSARESYEAGFHKRIPVNMTIQIKTGQPVILAVDDSGAEDIKREIKNKHFVGIQSEYISEKAHTTALTASRVEAQLSKTGGTPFFLNHCRTELEEGATAPISEINALRKRALDELETLRRNAYPNRDSKLCAKHPINIEGEYESRTQEIDKALKKSQVSNKNQTIKKNSLYYFQWKGKCELPDFKIDRIYLPYQYFLEEYDQSEIQRLDAQEIELVAAFPAITKGFHDHNIKRNLNQLTKNPHIKGLMLGNLAHLEICRKTDFPLYADSSLNTLNSNTLRVLRSMGFRGITISHEADSLQIKNMDKQDIELEQVVFGKIPVMHSAYCPISCNNAGRGMTGHIPKQKRPFYLKDRTGKEIFILRDCNSCKTTLLAEFKQNAGIKIAMASCEADWRRINLIDEAEKKEW